MVEQTAGQRTAAEHIERAGKIGKRPAGTAASSGERPISLWGRSKNESY